MFAKNLLTTTPSGNIASKRPTVEVNVHVDRRAENVALEIIAEADNYWSLSTYDLEGEAAPLSFSVKLEGLKVGKYTVYAILYSLDSKGKQHETVIKQRDPLEVF